MYKSLTIFNILTGCNLLKKSDLSRLSVEQPVGRFLLHLIWFSREKGKEVTQSTENSKNSLAFLISPTFMIVIVSLSCY